jgi:hypothetical protein
VPFVLSPNPRPAAIFHGHPAGFSGQFETAKYDQKR